MSVLIVLVNYWLIPIYGIEGAAIGSALVMLGFNGIKFLYLKIKLGLNPFSGETLRIFLAGGLVVLFWLANLGDIHPIGSLAIKSILVFISYGLLSFLLKIGREEWGWIIKKVKTSGP